MIYRHTLRGHTYQFADLIDVMAKATPARSGDELAGCAAQSDACLLYTSDAADDTLNV